MTEIRQWLDRIGLARYAELFEQNELRTDVLGELSEDDLKELQIPLGDRKRILKAIATHAAKPAATSLISPESDRGVTQAKAVSSAAERRQLTVMFCDLVGSTELAARTDPEDLREIMRSYQDVCAGVVARFDGYLAQFLGDGVLSYFGYPRAHEHAAERAIRASLAIIEAVGRLAPRGGHRLSVRIGVATGLVVVGAVDAAGGASEHSAFGDTPNLAARLQAVAEADTIIIADSTHALTRGTFQYADMGTMETKGVPYPVRMWRVIGEAGVSRFEAAHPAGLSEFVGREQEVALLLNRWEQAAGGEGQAILLCGEAGIGKSRIGEQLRRRLSAADLFSTRYQCSPFHLNSPLQPAIAQLEHAAGLKADDDDNIRLGKLEDLLRPTTPDMSQAVPLIAALLRIPLDQRYAPPQLTADVAKRRMLEALVDQFAELSKIKPVYWLVEDAHWIDPSTHDLIGMCLDRIRECRVLAVITFRPEFTPPWQHLPHVTTLTLNRLARNRCLELIANLCNGRPLPQEVLDQIIAKTDGTPLFIEELTKTILESGLVVERAGRYELTGPVPPLAIPATLQDSLMARLDHLAPVKEVAQIGSVIGREFTYDLLAAVAPMGENQLGEALSRLAAAELVFVRGQPPEATYIFKHALVQEAAYSSLLRARRHQVHARIAAALQSKFPETESRRPELLAHHYGAAGLDDRAKDYWTRAGRQACASSSYAEAVSHFANALALVRKAPLSPERTREESQLLLDQAMAAEQAISVVTLKGAGSIEASRIADEAVKISAPLGDDPLHFRAHWTQWIHNSLSGNLPAASEKADLLVNMANRLGGADLRLQAYHARWTTAILRGQVTLAREDVEHGIKLYDFDQHHGHLAIYGAHDPGVCAYSAGACAFWQAGFAERAARMIKEATALGDRLNHPISQAMGRQRGGYIAMMTGDAHQARQYAEAVAESAGQANLRLYLEGSQFVAGWAMTRFGEPERGGQQMEAAFRSLLDAKHPAYLTFFGTLIAGVKLEMGRAAAALEFLDDLQQISDTHQKMFLPDVHRLRADALRRLDPRDRRVEEEYQTALRIARQQGAPALELRAATGLASWLADHGRPREGLELLQGVYQGFSEGFATADLVAAKSLLDALR